MTILCLGDSLTAPFQIPPEESWVCLLNRYTKHRWVNGGIPGDTALGMLARLASAAEQPGADAVLWMGGFNDILVSGSAASAQSALMAAVNQCAFRGVRPVVGIPYLPRRIPEKWLGAHTQAELLAVFQDYLRHLAWLCGALHLRQVDFSPVTAGGADTLLPDGVHPNALGHRRMFETVMRELSLP